ncbi:MAG TPA: PEP-CTERM sorting domain-containing protein [Verrucomicrobiota bacterium]|nr:PEP-CTERM sorting domain-containing protein [Verrucomicrobiota bacterium]HQB15088.1 PEP-CTERM sorting domain-containing protein [Verrucomicrobiota bacterium]
MKRTAIASLLLLLAVTVASAQVVIIADDYNVTGNGTGFGLDTGVNSGINPPVTRLTGSAADNLRYIQTGTGKAATAFSVTGNKLEVANAASSGRFVLSADGVTPYDFSSALGIGSATPANPVVYDITISMANYASGIARFSFGLGTEDTTVDNQDFCLQLWRPTASADYYRIQKRIDTGSSGLAGDINDLIVDLPPGTRNTEVDFLIRITDAGAETTTFSSQVQVSLDGGNTWLYDSSTDPALVNGWRLDGSERYFIWDQAPLTGTGRFTYDNFSVTMIPEPSTLALGLLGGLGMLLGRRSRHR